MNNGLSDLSGFINDLSVLGGFIGDVNASVTEVNKIKRGEVDGIKLYNCRAKGDVLIICVSLVAVWLGTLWAYMEFWGYDIPKVKFIMVVWFLVNTAFTVLLGRAVYYYHKYSEECYLTEAGIVSIPILYKKDRCKFSYSKSYTNGVKKSTVEVKMRQRGKTIISDFVVLEREDDAEEMVKKINADSDKMAVFW